MPVLEEGPSGSPSRCTKFGFQACGRTPAPALPVLGSRGGSPLPGGPLSAIFWIHSRFCLQGECSLAIFWRVGGSDLLRRAPDRQDRGPTDRGFLEGSQFPRLVAPAAARTYIFPRPVLGEIMVFSKFGFAVPEPRLRLGSGTAPGGASPQGWFQP